MEPIQYLLAANIVVWLGFGIYLLVLARAQKHLARRIGQMERSHE